MYSYKINQCAKKYFKVTCLDLSPNVKISELLMKRSTVLTKKISHKIGQIYKSNIALKSIFNFRTIFKLHSHISIRCAQIPDIMKKHYLIHSPNLFVTILLLNDWTKLTKLNISKKDRYTKKCRVKNF